MAQNSATVQKWKRAKGEERQCKSANRPMAGAKVQKWKTEKGDRGPE